MDFSSSQSETLQLDQSVQSEIATTQQFLTDTFGCARTYYHATHDASAPMPNFDEKNVSMDDSGAGSSTDIGPLVTKGAITAGLSELHQPVAKGADSKQLVEDLRSMEAVTGVTDKAMPVDTTFDNAKVNQDMYVAELVSARARTQALGNMLTRYRDELDQIKAIVGKDHYQVVADLKHAEQQCEQQLIELLRKP